MNKLRNYNINNKHKQPLISLGYPTQHKSNIKKEYPPKINVEKSKYEMIREKVNENNNYISKGEHQDKTKQKQQINIGL
jgi:hypothetical protein